jgi:hypothetical protein
MKSRFFFKPRFAGDVKLGEKLFVPAGTAVEEEEVVVIDRSLLRG